MNNRLVTGALAGIILVSLGGCSLWTVASDDVPPPPVMSRQARLLQVPDDLRLPRASVVTLSLPGLNAPAVTAPVVTAPVTTAPTITSPVVTSPVVTAPAVTAPVVAFKALNVPPSVVAATEPRVPAVVTPTAVEEPAKMIFAPYTTTSRENVQPKTWVVNPTHDFPWIAGAQPARVNEETAVGLGSRMFGRLFAKVEFNTKALAAPEQPIKELPVPAVQQKKPTSLLSRFFKSDTKQEEIGALAAPMPAPASSVLLQAASVRCSGATCLDVARDMLLKDADAKGWAMLLSRRVSMHQSFQFLRSDRVVWVEVDFDGKNSLDLEYALMPVQ